MEAFIFLFYDANPASGGSQADIASVSAVFIILICFVLFDTKQGKQLSYQLQPDIQPALLGSHFGKICHYSKVLCFVCLDDFDCFFSPPCPV